MEARIASEPVAAWLERLEAAGVPCGPVLAREAVQADVQVRANGLVDEVRAARSRRGAPARRPFRSGDGPATRVGAAPLLGADTESVLAGARHEIRGRGRAASSSASRFGERSERFEPRLEPVFGEWADDRDDALGARLAGIGWAELWADPELLGPTVAGAIELGRAVAPLHLVDEATLGAPLAVGQPRVATAPAGTREPTLDSTGTVVLAARGGTSRPADQPERWRAWSAATLGYLAGLSRRALDGAVAHARSREQFGAPLASLPAVQERLADAALLADGLELTAWSAAAPADGDPALPASALRWAGAACRDVTASAQQVHGAVGFALESGVHLRTGVPRPSRSGQTRSVATGADYLLALRKPRKGSAVERGWRRAAGHPDCGP